MIPQFDVIIIGAGPGGLFCAREAAAKGLRVALVDRQAEAGRKLALAGGGMGNFTNRHLDERHYVGENPKFCRPILRQFGTEKVLDLLRECGLPWEEREFGQIFGLRPASELTKALLQQLRKAGVPCFFGQQVKKVDVGLEGRPFRVKLEGTELTAAQLVVATGGTAFPQSGASDFGAVLAARLGHDIIPFRPVLVPLHPPRNWPLHGLAGISLNAAITVITKNGAAIADPCGARPLLFTHQGISGPACLVASCHWSPGDTLLINFLPEHSVLELLNQTEHGKVLVKNLFSRYLPSRLAERLVPDDLASRKSAELGKKDRQRLVEAIHQHRVTPEASAGFKKAEASAGGVATAQLNSSLESKICPGLFFCGEVVDITGLLGGYNIHWALAGAKAVAKTLRKVE